MKPTLQTLTRTKNTLTQSWTYRHPQTIAILTLITVIIVQNTTTLQNNTYRAIIDALPTNTTTATNPNHAPDALLSCDYKCFTVAWVNLRTDELYTEQEQTTLNNLRHTSRIQALTEANDQFKDVILNQ